jgi:glycosyltransferase involved in cell wall biosynthesis
MRLAVMMRAIDQGGGLHIYTRRLVESMLAAASRHHFLLYFRTDEWLGQFSDRPNATARVVRAPHKLLWDQVAVPWRAWRDDRADVIFNPKFSVPLLALGKVAMSLREPTWWVWPEHYPAWNAWFMRATIPLYARRAAALFPISRFVLEENRKYLDLDESKVSLAYPAPNKHFRVVEDADRLAEARRKYSLPDRFVFTAARVTHPGIEETSDFFPGKNVETTVRAFAACRERIPHFLVVAGAQIPEYLAQIGITSEELERVRFLGHVDRADMPLMHNLSSLFVLASYYESYGHALVEAMACGCPAVASSAGASPEIAGGATLLADPDSPHDFSEKLVELLQNEPLRRELRTTGLERAAYFRWEVTARIVLRGLERAIDGPPPGWKPRAAS